VETIFGSQFFNQSSDGSSITVLRDFWIFWVIAIPVTVVVIYIWYVMSRRQSRLGAKEKWYLIKLSNDRTEKAT
jgi:cytochrome c-type biogenesis protein CcmH/NrfF